MDVIGVRVQGFAGTYAIYIFSTGPGSYHRSGFITSDRVGGLVKGRGRRAVASIVQYVRYSSAHEPSARGSFLRYKCQTSTIDNVRQIEL